MTYQDAVQLQAGSTRIGAPYLLLNRPEAFPAPG